MCDGASQPVNVGDALGMLDRALSYLTATDAASLPAAVQADALRALGRAEAKHTAAQARLLSVFAAQGGCEDDGHGGARAWLKWQTRVSHGAAVAAVAWARRLAAHPAIAGALAAGELSPSWARHLCEWSDRLPEDRRSDADEILAGAARGGADLAALAGLAREMYERSCQDGDTEPEEDRFTDRWFRLGITFQGAGRAEGDLTPGCAAALAAVLEALGKKAGPEDTRTSWQRRHDALEEACRRLIRAGMVPARAGQPTQVLVHLTLAQVREATGASAAEDAWAAARAAQPGWLTGPEADAALCDATVVPIVTGHVDWAALDQLTDTFLLGHGTGRHTGSAPGHHNGTGQCGSAGPGQAGGYQCGDADREQPGSAGRSGAGRVPTAGFGGAGRSGAGRVPAAGFGGAGRAGAGRASTADLGSAGRAGAGRVPAAGLDGDHLAKTGRPGRGPGARPGEPAACGCTCGGCRGPAPVPLTPASRDRLRRALLGLAADALSGPDGLAARLRAALNGQPLATISLPLDIGAATETIPAHLRRAATTRHPHCAFPGCDQPASVCDIHHLLPRSRGGPTSLPNLVPLCGFHHLTAIHRWGWSLALHTDGTTTATSPDGRRTLHSHSPPGHDPPSHSPPGHDPPSHGPPGHSPPGHSPDGTRAPPTTARPAALPNATTSGLPTWWASLPA